MAGDLEQLLDEPVAAPTSLLRLACQVNFACNVDEVSKSRKGWKAFSVKSVLGSHVLCGQQVTYEQQVRATERRCTLYGDGKYGE